MDFDFDTSMWDEIQDMPGEIFDFDEFIEANCSEDDLTEVGRQSVAEFRQFHT